MRKLKTVSASSPEFQGAVKSYNGSLWISINAHLRGLSPKDFLGHLQASKERATIFIRELSSICFDSHESLHTCYDFLKSILDSYHSIFESLPYFVKSEISTMQIEEYRKASLIIENLNSWTNTFLLANHLRMYEGKSAFENLSMLLNKVHEEIGFENKDRSKTFKFQKMTIEKCMNNCMEYSDQWLSLNLPPLKNLPRSHCLINLDTLTNFHRITERTIGDPLESINQIITSLAVWASYFDFYVSMFGYWDVPERYRVQISSLCETLFRLLDAWVITPECVENSPYLNMPKVNPVLNRIFNELGTIPVVSNSICIHLCTSFSRILNHFENYIEEGSKEFAFEIDAEQLEAFVSNINSVGKVFCNKRNELSRAFDTSLHYRMQIKGCEYGYAYYRLHGVVRVIFPGLNSASPELNIFCKRSVAEDAPRLLRLFLSSFNQSENAENEHVAVFYSKPEFPQWDGDIITIDDPRYCPPISSRRLNKEHYHCIFQDAPSCLNFLRSNPARKFDASLEFPSSPFDVYVSEAMQMLDENLLGLTDRLRSLSNSSNWLSACDLQPKLGNSFFSSLSMFLQVFLRPSRVQKSGQCRLRALNLCEIWSEFLKKHDNVKWRRMFAKFVEFGAESTEVLLGLELKDEITEFFEFLLAECRNGNIFRSDVSVNFPEEKSTSNSALQSRVAAKRSSAACSSVVANHPTTFRWQRLRYLGRGSFGNVYEIMNLDNGNLYAMKETKDVTFCDGKTVFESSQIEFNVVRRLNHPNIIKYFALEKSGEYVRLFMEPCGAGSLTKLMNMGPINDLFLLKLYCRQILEGLVYLHSKNIVHRDLKPENIMMDWEGNLKLVDFGSLLCIKPTGDSTEELRCISPNGLVGTPPYMAPEIVLNGPASEKSDIWSFGCTVFHLASANRPWADAPNEWGIFYALGTGDMRQFLKEREFIEPKTLAFIMKCLNRDPAKRPLAIELLLDPFLSR